jgi:hypothetical protein
MEASLNTVGSILSVAVIFIATFFAIVFLLRNAVQKMPANLTISIASLVLANVVLILSTLAIFNVLGGKSLLTGTTINDSPPPFSRSP